MSDRYAIDFTDNNGWFFDTPANGDAFRSAIPQATTSSDVRRLPGRRR
jgi:hypothetical protein